MKKKNVMIIISQLTGGGAEKVACNLTFSLNKKFNTYLVVFDHRNATYDYCGSLISLEAPKSKYKITKVFNNIKRVKKISKLKKELKIDISISLLNTPNLINVMTRKNSSTIVSVRHLQSYFDTTFFKKLQSKIVFKRADRVISISKRIEQDLIENYKTDTKKLITIYNSCDYEKISKLAEEEITDINEKNLFQDSFTLINCARLTNVKGQWHLIRAFSELIKKIPNAKLVFLGQGELENPLKNLVNNLGLNDKVFFLGFKKNPYKYISKANYFLFSSLSEGLGNVLLECMACGTPIISSDCIAGPREIINPISINEPYDKTEAVYGEYGILVPSFKNDNFDSISPLNNQELILNEVLTKCYFNPEIHEKYKALSLKRILDFSENNIEKEWEQVFQKIN